MLRKTLKRILSASAISIAFFAIGILPVHAASVKLTLHSENKDYVVGGDLLKTWQSAPTQKTSYISMEPEQNLNNFVLVELGLEEQNNNQVHLENYDISSMYKYLKGIETEINQDPKDAMMRVDNDRVT